MARYIVQVGVVYVDMATLSSRGVPRVRRVNSVLRLTPRPYQCFPCLKRDCVPRHFSTSSVRRDEGSRGERGPFRSRLRLALQRTKVQWYPIPIGLGIGFLGFTQLYRQQRQQQGEVQRTEEEEDGEHSPERDQGGKGRPKKRKRIRPSGPWYVHNALDPIY